jgi:hypothetical protein
MYAPPGALECGALAPPLQSGSKLPHSKAAALRQPAMFKSRTQWHCGNCSQCIDRRFATVASGCSQYDRVTDYVSDVFTGPRKDRYQKNIAVDYVRHGVELQRWLAQAPALWGLRSPEGIL